MKYFLAGVVAAGALAACAEPFIGVESDPSTHTVKFSAVSTDCGLDTQLEFLFVGPGSDKDYESMFVTDASINDICEAFVKAGFPVGVPYDFPGYAFWPSGPEVAMEPSFASLVREMRGEETPPIVYTGGRRDAAGIPDAEKESPMALFALYNCTQSILQLDDSLDQSPVYGRFQPAVKIPKGERKTFTFKWDGKTATRRIDVVLSPGRLQEVLSGLRDASRDSEVSVCCSFDPEMTLAEAVDCATAISMIDSRTVKFNCSSNFYYRAFLPLEKWRERKERLAQPPEVLFREDGMILVNKILEDWSKDDSLDPILTVEPHEFDDIGKAAEFAASASGRTFTCLLFASPSMKLSTLVEFKKKAKSGILNWYVFKL